MKASPIGLNFAFTHFKWIDFEQHLSNVYGCALSAYHSVARWKPLRVWEHKTMVGCDEASWSGGGGAHVSGGAHGPGGLLSAGGSFEQDNTRLHTVHLGPPLVPSPQHGSVLKSNKPPKRNLRILLIQLCPCLRSSSFNRKIRMNSDRLGACTIRPSINRQAQLGSAVGKTLQTLVGARPPQIMQSSSPKSQGTHPPRVEVCNIEPPAHPYTKPVHARNLNF